MKIRLRGREARCPLCRVRHSESLDDTVVCPGCDVRYHRDCAQELGGCSTLGCPRLGLTVDAPTPEGEGRGERWRRGLRASRARRGERARLATAHREQRAQSGQRQGSARDTVADVGLEAGCCCAMGALEMLAGGILVGLLLFPPGAQVARGPAPARQEAPAAREPGEAGAPGEAESPSRADVSRPTRRS